MNQALQLNLTPPQFPLHTICVEVAKSQYLGFGILKRFGILGLEFLVPDDKPHSTFGAVPQGPPCLITGRIHCAFVRSKGRAHGQKCITCNPTAKKQAQNPPRAFFGGFFSGWTLLGLTEVPFALECLPGGGSLIEGILLLTSLPNRTSAKFSKILGAWRTSMFCETRLTAAAKA